MKLSGKKIKAGVAVLGGVLALGVLTPKASYALFGIDDTIYWIQQLAAMSSQLATMRQQYTQITNQYTQAVAMAKQFTSIQRNQWLMQFTRPFTNPTVNTYGETATWGSLMNGNPGLAGNAWTNATVPLTTQPFRSDDPNIARRDVASLAFVEQVDGGSQQCLATVAQYRMNYAANQNAIASLNAAIADGSAGSNAAVQQQNLANLQAAQMMNEMRSQSAMQSCLAEQQMLSNKVQRDAIADQINFESAIKSQAQPGWGNAAQSMYGYSPASSLR